ncbi:hypothetical protein DW862_07965 [Bacteroides sp. AM37-9]|nr:hypothetical protein DW862_07965 [Bacteroides sp. AM37-9]
MNKHLVKKIYWHKTISCIVISHQTAECILLSVNLLFTRAKGTKKRANHSAPPLKNPHKWDSSFSSSFIYSLPENVFFLIPNQNNLFPKN